MWWGIWLPQNKVHICSGNRDCGRGREGEEFKNASLATLAGNSGSIFVVNSGSANIWGVVIEL